MHLLVHLAPFDLAVVVGEAVAQAQQHQLIAAVLLLQKLVILGDDLQPHVFLHSDQLPHGVGADSSDCAPLFLPLRPLLLVELLQKRQHLLSPFLALIDALEVVALEVALLLGKELLALEQLLLLRLLVELLAPVREEVLSE